LTIRNRIMKILLRNLKKFFFVLLLLAFSGIVNAQCSINSSISTSSLTCGTLPLTSCGGVLYIGNGTDSMILTMNANLDLSCLGAIRFIIRNGATVDFSNGNYDLTLKEGSSIEIEPGGQLGAASNCSASDLIKIGTEKIASCNGSGGGVLMDFPTLVSNGGYSSISASASPSSFCNSGSSIITALANPSSGATYKWYAVSSGGSPVFTGNPFSTGTITATTTYYVEASYASPAYTTVRKPVTVTVNPLPTITGTLNVCEGSMTTLTGSPTANATTPWTSSAPSVATVSSSGVVTGVSGGTSVITYMNSNGCTKTATVVVASLVNNVGSGFSGSSFCAGNQATITFDANNGSGVYPYTLIYRNDTTNATASVTIANDNPTAFNIVPNPIVTTHYTLVSITDANGCVRTSSFGDSTAIVTINALPNTPTIGTITHPTCFLSTGSVFLSGLPSGNWTVNPGGIAGNSSNTTISGLASGIYNFTVTDASGCTSLASANVVINAQPGTPLTPTITSFTFPTFADNDGTITLGNLPAGTWVGHQIKDGGTPTNISGTGSTYTVTGLANGSYEFEVVGICVSPKSASTPLITVPYTPAVSAATAVNCIGFTANWPATPTATSYLLDVSTVSSFATFVAGYQDRNVGNVLTYPVTGLNPATTYYYRIRAQNATLISQYSNVLSVTLNALPSPPGTITGNQNQCAGNTSQVYSVVPVVGATSYDWFIPTDWTITSGAGTNAITVTVGSNSGNINVNAINSCGTGYSPNLWVNVSALTVAGSITPTNTNVCSGSNYTNLSLSGHTGSVIRWESSIDNFATAGIPIANTNNSLGVSNLAADTYFRAVVQSGGCNLLYSNSVKITVYGAMTAPGGISVNGSLVYPPSGSGISYCASTSTVFSIAPVANATSYTWVIPTGWTLVSGSGTNTVTVITGTNSQSANIEVYANNLGCGNTTSNYLYLYLVPSTTPQVALVQPTCAVATGTITVTSPAPAAGITYTLVGTNPVVAPVTNVTGVFSGLGVGVYDVTVNNSSYVAAYPQAVVPFSSCVTTTSVTIDPLVTNTWNGAWSNGVPTIDQNIVFNTGFSSTADVNGCSCTVNNGAVVFNPTHTLKVANWVHVNGGSLTFADTASLVQINNVLNSGNISYLRTTNSIVLGTDYTYWSSPVSPQNIGSFSPKTKEGMMFSYDSSIDDWKQEYLSTSMAAGVGYIVRGPEPSAIPAPPSTYTVTFMGVPHNGDYSIPAIADKSYLLGNPYPSALDADTFLNVNSNVLDGTLYFWTHNTAIAANVSNPGTGVYAYSGNDYATYNQTGGTAAAPTGGSVPNGKIGAGQGFFASTKTSISGASIVYNNNMRVGVGGIIGTNSQFFKTRNQKEKVVNSIEKNRVWLNLTNTQGAFKQTLVGYVTDATNDYDSRFDGVSFDGNEFVDFYSINQDKNLAIQGRALPFDENDEVPLGFRTTINGTFSINIDQVDGVLANQSVFLEDKLTNTVSDLKNGNYTFDTAAGTFDNRFVLKYKSSDKTLSIDEMDASDGISVLYSNNYKTLIIINNVLDATVNSVTLFNMLGQKITDWDVRDKEQNSIQIPIKNISPEIYIVKVKTTKGETSKKIIIR